MTLPELLIRDATSSDVEACARIMADEANEHPDVWRARFADVLGDPSRHFLVAEADGEIVGYAQSRFVTRPDGLEGQPPGGWFLSGLAVARAQRRRGIGRALTQARLARLVGEGVVFYAAEPDNGGTIQLHQQLGFRRVGELSLGGHDRPLALFRLDL